MTRYLKTSLPALAFALMCTSGAANAADRYDDLGLSADVIAKIKALDKGMHIPTARGDAIASLTSPSAAGGAGVVGSMSVMYVDHWATTKKEDGNMTIALSWGDPYNSLGYLFSVTPDSIGINHSFAKNGGFGFRLNHYVLDHTSVALGISNLGGWNAWEGNPNTYYGAITHSMVVKSLPVTFNAGMGTGSLEDQFAKNDEKARGFAGVGVSPIEHLSVVADYSARQLSFGGTYIIDYFKDFPGFIGVARVNANEYDNTKAFMRYTAGISYKFK